MNKNNFENVPCVWEPRGGRGVYYSKFIKLIEQQYKVKIDSYWDLHKWSVQNIDKFWYELWHFVGIKSSKIFDKVIDLSVPMSETPKWFIGARLNLAENLLRHKDDHVALICIGEDRDKQVYTYAQIYEEVKRYSAAFRKIGLKKGDRIVGYLSNREEALFAMLGANTVGAIWTGILPLIGAQAVLDRLKIINPSIIFSVDRMKYNQEEVEMLPKLKEISKGLSSLMKIVIVPSKPDSVKKDINDIPKSFFLEEFLEFGLEEDGTIPELVFEQMDFSDPTVISYTSGTTGPPKALVHDHGCLLCSVRDQCLIGDFSRNGIGMSVSPTGWMTWFLAVFQFYLGSTHILFDGVPFFLTRTYLWDLVDEYKVTNLLITPSILDEMEKQGCVPTDKHKLTSLQAIFSASSVVKPQNCDFVCQKIKPGILFGSAYGSTEAMGSSMSFHPTLPIYRAEITCPALGADVQCVDDAGKSIEGVFGDLVLATPMPSLPLGMYGDVDDIKYKETYFSKYPDKFSMGDFAAINPITKGVVIHCRSDEILKPGGWRFGSAEIYNVVNILDEVHDSLCASQYSKNKNERAVLFLRLRDGLKLNDEIVKKVKSRIAEELTRNHVPGLIMEVKDIPYNINGKKMEVLVKKIINNMPYNPEVVINQESLQCFQNVPPYED